jgi:DNA-binding NarL/FixJ family response regulator
MLQALAAKTRERVVLLCGNGDGVLVIGQTLMDRGVKVHFLREFYAAVENASEYAQCIVIVDRDHTIGSESSLLRLRLGTQRNVAVLAIGTEASYEQAGELVRTGVCGFIQPTFSGDLLERIFDSVLDGELWVTRQLLTSMVGKQPTTPASLLTRREMEVVRRMVAGCNNREIAEALYVTRDTVRWHLRSAYAKLGVHDRYAVAELLWLGSESETGHFSEDHFNKDSMRQPA